MTLFLVGRVNKLKKHRWEVMGLFHTEDEAISHCTSWYDFYGPITLNLPMKSTPGMWPGCRYPVAEDYYKRHPEKAPEECRERFDRLR